MSGDYGNYFFSLALGPVSGIWKAMTAIAIDTPTRIRRDWLRLPVRSKAYPPINGPMIAPLIPIQSIRPLALPTASFGNSSTGSTNVITKMV